MNFSGSRGSIGLGVGLALLTFTAVFLIGLFSGTAVLTLLLRGALSALIMGIAGFGLGVLIERFVPDAWEGAGNKESPESEGYTDEGGAVLPETGGAFSHTVGEDMPLKPLGDVVLPDGSEDIDGSSAGKRASHAMPKGTKVVGNIRIINDKQFPDDPEDYAKAIRTMMNKDNG